MPCEKIFLRFYEIILNKDLSNKKPGTILEIRKGLGFIVKCGKDALFITKVQPESKAQMSAFDFVNGAQIKIGGLFL